MACGPGVGRLSNLPSRNLAILFILLLFLPFLVPLLCPTAVQASLGFSAMSIRRSKVEGKL